MRFHRADVVEATFDESAPPPPPGVQEESDDAENLNERFERAQKEPTHGSETSAAAPAQPSSSSRFGSDVVAVAVAVAEGAEPAADVAMPSSPITPPSARWFPFGASYCDDILFDQSLTNEEIVVQLRQKSREGKYKHLPLPVPPPVPASAMTPMPVATPPQPPVFSVDEGLGQLTAAALIFNTME